MPRVKTEDERSPYETFCPYPKKSSCVLSRVYIRSFVYTQLCSFLSGHVRSANTKLAHDIMNKFISRRNGIRNVSKTRDGHKPVVKHVT